MTQRALELIARADVILYDRLVPAGALDGARPDAELHYVGKSPGAASVSQEDINALLVEHGRTGATVVRLKGGDPFVFGRGGEEAEALAEAGVPFEVVPGVTAGIAAPAYAGIPVTHRDEASAVAFVTGHEDPAKDESAIDWNALAAFPGTLVFYMGVRRLPEISARLIEAGRPATEPAAVVERGTLPGQRTVTAPLAEIADAAAGVKPPAVTLVGPVARLREGLAWIERRPLHGRRVVVTRARPQASGLAATLRGLGAEVVEAPAIRIEPRSVEAELLGYDLVCFTSPNGVDLFFDALAGRGQDARSLAGTQVAAIGPGTARELAARGIRADFVPERSVAEALLEELGGLDVEGKRVLIPRAAEARDVLPDGLRERGADVDVVPLYDTVGEPLEAGVVEALEGADYVTFTSSSTVTRFLEAAGDGVPNGARVVSIGPVTSATARERGLEVHVEAERHDIDGLVEALVCRRRRTMIVSLLTDYGHEDEFVGVCHAVIRGIAPDVPIVDLTHGISRYGVRQGAIVLRNSLPYVPVGVHVAIVDPQVGTERRGVAVRTGDGRALVGPDNGLLSLAWEQCGGVVEAVDISRSPHRLEPVSATFHGRDIFAPVAAHLAAGAELADAGQHVEPDELQVLALPEPKVSEGEVVAHVLLVDRFGNASLDVAHADLAGSGLATRQARRDRGRGASASSRCSSRRSPTSARAR